MSPVKIPTRVEYKAIPVKEILKDMKNFSSLMVDLAYYSLVYNDKKLANEVLRIEEYVDSLWNLLVMQASLSVRDAEDAESMVGVMKLASATNKISDAAGDLAIMTLLNMPLHSSVRAAIIGGEEAVSRIKIRNESKIVGLTLGNAFSKLNIALDVIAVRKGYTWIFAPREDYKLELGSVLIVRGPKEAIDKLRIAAKDYVSLEETVEVEEVEEEIAKDLIRLKDIGEFMLDLAYLATLTNNRDLALEVLELEEYVDQIHIDLERKVVRKLRKDNPDEVVSILRTIISLENIADAAAEIAAIVTSEVAPHPILKRVIEESEERVMIATIPRRLNGKTIEELNLDVHGAVVVALRKDHEWIIDPREDTVLREGNKLIIRCYKESLDQLKKVLIT
ncbi:MAG: hypothetical protein DRO23_05515 [Thermoprotei archaeon]|nr:MAG: hypothetical protein DRO23_05515 [Thermoprotei archaeon]